MVNISNGEHDNPHELPKDNLEGSLDTVYHDYTHIDTRRDRKKIRIHISTFSRSQKDICN